MELNWLEILNKVFEVAIIPIIGAATVYLVTLIQAKKIELASKTKNATIKKYIEMLDKTIEECVIATNQTYVQSLKAQGSFNAKAQKTAFKLTYDSVMSILTDEAQTYLSEALKDMNAYITTKIESQIVVTKK